jgi:hypothetical protein
VERRGRIAKEANEQDEQSKRRRCIQFQACPKCVVLKMKSPGFKLSSSYFFDAVQWSASHDMVPKIVLERDPIHLFI